MIWDLDQNHILYMIACTTFGQSIQRGSRGKKKKKDYSFEDTDNDNEPTISQVK